MDELRAELAATFDIAHLEAAHKKKLAQAGGREYAWVYRPEIPLLLQAVRDCDAWMAAVRESNQPPNTGALGPFVRLGLALRFARHLEGGVGRIEELRRLAIDGDFLQFANKAFELETALFLAHTSGRTEIAFGPIGGKPDLWIGSGLYAIPVECKVVSGGARPSPRCLGEWRRFVIHTVKRMKLHGVSAGICVRGRQEFGPKSHSTLVTLVNDLLAELSNCHDDTWVVRSESSGDFLVYGVRLCAWDRPRPPIDVPLGLDGDLCVWTQYDTGTNELRNPYFFALKFQSPTLRADAVLDNFKSAAAQVAQTCPSGSGLVILKVAGLRPGDLFEIDNAIRDGLSTRPHVAAAVMLWDESGISDTDSGGRGDKRWVFTLRPYVIANERARVRIGWPDSKATFFPAPPVAVLRTENGELVPFDFEQEQQLLASGTVLGKGRGKSALLLNARGGAIPSFPHIIPESRDVTEEAGQMTFYLSFAQPIAQCLFPVEADRLFFEWMIVGNTHFRVYRDRALNLRVNRRTPAYQDNVAVDLVPYGHAVELLIQLVWRREDMTASVRWSDNGPAALCRSVRSSLG